MEVNKKEAEKQFGIDDEGDGLKIWRKIKTQKE